LSHNYINTLLEENIIITYEGRKIKILKQNTHPDPVVIDERANEFRQNYCLKSKIDYFRMGTV